MDYTNSKNIEKKDCTGKIFRNIIRNCDFSPSGGLKKTVYLINTDEIDRQGTQLSANRMKVTNLVLKSGAKIYKAEGEGKYPQGAVELVKGDFGNKWKHKLTIALTYYGEIEREQVQQLVKNGLVTPIIEHKNTGLQGELTHDMLGFDSGLAIQTVNWSSNENNGVVTLELASDEGQDEGTDRKIFMINDSVNETEAFITANLQA